MKIEIFCINKYKMAGKQKQILNMVAITRNCTTCFKSGNINKKCSRCKKTYYCSTECQEKNWNQHRNVCFPSRITQESTILTPYYYDLYSYHILHILNFPHYHSYFFLGT